MKRFLVNLANLNFLGESFLVVNSYNKTEKNNLSNLGMPNDNYPNLNAQLSQFNYLEFRELYPNLNFDDYEILETKFSDETKLTTKAKFETVSAKELNPIILIDFEDSFENETEKEIFHTVTSHKGTFYKGKYNKLILEKPFDWCQMFNLEGPNLEGDNWFYVNDSITSLGDSSYINWEFGGTKISVASHDSGIFKLKFGFRMFEYSGFIKIYLNEKTTFLCKIREKNSEEIIELQYSIADLLLKSKTNNNYYNILNDINSSLFLEDECISICFPGFLLSLGDVYYDTSFQIEKI